jgi:pantoate--beta-alanine ligase
VIAKVVEIDQVRSAVAQARKNGKTIGLVPTMGALHAGHVSLMQAARRDTGYVVVSIFVNPIQFGPNEDLSRYPRPLERDLEICRQQSVDLVFAPAVETIYPPEFRTFVEVSTLGDTLCGPSRPGHFRGVATVVLKLFNIVQPDIAYFGQKDGQQARTIRQMVRDLDVPVSISICPTVREADGLALSSRNQYLTPEQRRQANVLFRALQETKALIEAGERDPATACAALRQRIESVPDAVIDYTEVVDAESMHPQEALREEVMLAVAVKFGTTRLIDNVLVDLTRREQMGRGTTGARCRETESRS